MYLVGLPIFLKAKYWLRFKKLKKLDERLKGDRENMNPREVFRGKMEWSGLRSDLDIGLDEDLLLVSPPTLKECMIGVWRAGKEDILKALTFLSSPRV